MEEALDDDAAVKYDEIRAIASKNWLSSASVSLAKLDQVKARVYNVGLEIKPVAPGRGGGTSQAASSASGSQATLQLDADPPLTNVMSQRTAWGSNTSIPDLIRQQSERQRPESASVSRRVRPPSGRRMRPQSAKESGNAVGKGQKPPTGIAVKGAKFDPSSRPPKSTPHQNVTTGWIGPPAGVVLDPNVIEDNSVQKYAKRNGRQVAKLSLAYAGDLTEPFHPPPPAGSPDLIDMIRDAQRNVDGEFLSDDSFLSDEEKPVKTRPKSSVKPPRPSSGKKNAKQKKEKLLRRPTPEPIHFSLPTAEMDESADLDTDRLIGSFDASKSPIPFQSKPGFSYIHADVHGHLSQDGCLLSEGVAEMRGGLDVTDDELVVDVVDDDADTDDAENDREVESPKYNVQFDEANNITVDITPRYRGRPASASSAKTSKMYSGRSDLRFVKSRVDSGISLSSVPSASVKRTGSGFDLKGRVDSRPGSATGRVRTLVSRQRSTGKMRIPVVSVAYTEDSDKEGSRMKVPGAEDGSSEGRKEESESMKRAREGLITMVSQITEREPTGHWQEEQVPRPGSPKKYVSEKERNYYKEAVGEADEKKVTTKTLTLTGKDVSETKVIRTIDAQENRRREYQVPEVNKPPKRTAVSQESSQLSRLTTGLKSSVSADDTETQTPGGDPEYEARASEKTALSTSSAYRVKPRPISSPAVNRNREETKTDLKNRPKSSNAASSDFTTDKDQELSKENNAAVVSKKPSPRPASASKISGISKDAIKVSDAFKAIRESGLGPRPASSDRVYASYTTRAKSAPVKSKRKPAVAVEPVYIFTRKDEVDLDTPEIQECKEIHNRLKENGVNVTVDTLRRALLPPMDNSYYITPVDKPPLPDPTSGLLNSPEVWLAAEFKRLKLANKAVERANERLFMQKQAEMRKLKEADGTTADKKKLRKGKGKKIKRVQSAGL